MLAVSRVEFLMDNLVPLFSKKKMMRELKLTLTITICMWLLFAFPLKSVCKLSLVGLPVPYEISIAVLIFLSGLISFILAKVNQNIRGNVNQICIYDFFYYDS